MSNWTTGIGAAFEKIVTGTVTVSNAGTAVQVTSSSIPIPGVWVGADTSGGIMCVGDSSVKATSGSMQGIVLSPGNKSTFVQVNNLNLLWVDSQVSGGKLCYAYLQPA